MSDGESLLKAIIADPDDDTPRLIFADWLDEFKDRRWAEVIRVQVAMRVIRAEHPGVVRKVLTGGLPRTKKLLPVALKFRELCERQEAIADRIADMMSPWRWPAGVRALSVDRGFVDAVAASYSVWLGAAARIYRDTAVTRAVIDGGRPLPGLGFTPIGPAAWAHPDWPRVTFYFSEVAP